MACFLSGQVVIFPLCIVGQLLLCGVLAYGQPMSCQGDMAAIMPLHWMNFCYECVYLWYIQYFISIKIVMHVARSWMSCRISSITYITISVTTIENLCIYYMFICRIGSITVYTGIGVDALAALSSLVALGVVTLTPPGALATAELSSRGPSISVLHFCVYFDRAGHFITSNCISELNWLYLCVYMHICMCYMSYPSTTFLLYTLIPLPLLLCT